MKTLGFVLVILGIVSLVFGGLGFNRQRTVFQMGSMSAQVTEHRAIPVAPVAGVMSLAGGIVLLVVARKRRAA